MVTYSTYTLPLSMTYKSSDQYPKKVSEYDQEIPQSPTADNPVAPNTSYYILKDFKNAPPA